MAWGRDIEMLPPDTLHQESVAQIAAEKRSGCIAEVVNMPSLRCTREGCRRRLLSSSIGSSIWTTTCVTMGSDPMVTHGDSRLSL